MAKKTTAKPKKGGEKRARSTTQAASPHPPLVVGLRDPGMTPLLRCGLGGLAASIRAISPKTWPRPLELEGAVITVDQDRVTLDWKEAAPEDVLDALFKASFLVDRDGLIHCSAWFGGKAPPDLATRARLQSAVKKTFLQHGKATTKLGPLSQRRQQIDDLETTVQFQPYSTFAQMKAGPDVARALKSGSVELAGWAYPGAIERHVKYKTTRVRYGAGQAIAACFTMAGALSFDAPRAGVVIAPVPKNLIAFARQRPELTPRTVTEAFVSGLGDAVLTTQAALKMAEAHESSVEQTIGVLLRATVWAKQQKSRVGLVSAGSFAPEVLSRFETIARDLPAKVRVRKQEEHEETEDDGGFFISSSTLRCFVCENLAGSRRWYVGFAVARTSEKRPRFIHYYRDATNLGALFNEERKGLIDMTQYLDDSEATLVRSVHVALRQRFGAIAEESGSNRVGMRKRFDSERLKWRLAFSGAKTHEQIRAALADLWSRAGTNRELQSSWERVLPMLAPTHWQAARDLSLVALASYRGKEDNEVAGDEAHTNKGADQ